MFKGVAPTPRCRSHKTRFARTRLSQLSQRVTARTRVLVRDYFIVQSCLHEPAPDCSVLWGLPLCTGHLLRRPRGHIPRLCSGTLGLAPSHHCLLAVSRSVRDLVPPLTRARRTDEWSGWASASTPQSYVDPAEAEATQSLDAGTQKLEDVSRCFSCSQYDRVLNSLRSGGRRGRQGALQAERGGQAIREVRLLSGVGNHILPF
jgi:hypothetical protein